MGNLLGRTCAAVMAVLVTTSTMLIASPAHAAGAFTVTGVATLGSGAGVNDDQILFCQADCLTSGALGADDGSDFTDTSGHYSVGSLGGTYAVAVNYIEDQPGYDFALDPAYLKVDGAKYTLTTDFSEAYKLPVTANATFNFQIDPPVQNASATFKQATTGSVGYLPCAGHTTRINPSPFSPASAHVAYQWVWSPTSNPSSASDLHTISGATGITYTPGMSLVGKYLSVRMVGSLAGYVSWYGRAGVGAVGNPVNCNPKLLPIKSSWVSFGKKSGKAKHGKTVAVSGAKAKSKKYHLKLSYSWKLNGKVVGHGKKFKIPSSAKGKTLTVQVLFKRSGYKSKSKTIKFGKVK